jgi:hypothetical protein
LFTKKNNKFTFIYVIKFLIHFAIWNFLNPFFFYPVLHLDQVPQAAL